MPKTVAVALDTSQAKQNIQDETPGIVDVMDGGLSHRLSVALTAPLGCEIRQGRGVAPKKQDALVLLMNPRLKTIKFGIASAGPDQVLMRAVLHQLAVLNGDDTIGHSQCG